MSTNPTSGYTGQDTTNANTSNQEGVIPTVLSYVGLSPSQSRDTTTGTAGDATAEPAFGAAVGPNSGAGSSSRDGYVPAPTLNPHDEGRAKVVADRAVGGTSSTYDSGIQADNSNFGSSGSGIGSGVAGAGIGSGVGSGLGSESHRESGVGSGVGLDSHRQSGVGSGVGLDSHRESGVGSGVGLGSQRESGVGSGVGLGGSDRSASGAPGGSIAAGDELTGANKGNRAAAGDSEGATAGEAQATSESRTPHDAKPGRKQMENKSAIPVAGGIQLGEKHWGESDIIPDNPKPRGDENVSSASGQPDR